MEQKYIYIKIISFIIRTQYLIQIQNCLDNAFDKKKNNYNIIILCIDLFITFGTINLKKKTLKSFDLGKQGHSVLLKIHIHNKCNNKCKNNTNIT